MEKLNEIPLEIELDLSDVRPESDTAAFVVPPVMTEREIVLKECIFCLKKIGTGDKRCRYCLRYQPEPKAATVEVTIEPKPVPVEPSKPPEISWRQPPPPQLSNLKPKKKPVKAQPHPPCWKCSGKGKLTDLKICYICNGTGHALVAPPAPRPKTTALPKRKPFLPRTPQDIDPLDVIYVLAALGGGVLGFMATGWGGMIIGIAAVIIGVETFLKKKDEENQ